MKTSILSVLVLLMAGLFATHIQADESKSISSERDTVILINLFAVPVGKVEEAIVSWEASRDFLAQQPGYVSTKLHQSIAPDTQYQLVNVAEWESIEAFEAATAKMRTQPDIPQVEGVTFVPGLYDVIRH